MAEIDDPDADLLARLARGEPQAARELVERKLPRMLGLAQRLLGNRAEAEEVAQEGLVRAWQQVGHWQPGQARFDTWLHEVVLNLCRDRLRRRSVRREEALDEHAEAAAFADPGPTPEQQLDHAQHSARVAAALDALPPRQREALVLHYYQALPQAEAAALMGVSVDALESLLARARRSLRARLQDASTSTSAIAAPAPAEPGGSPP